MPGVSTARVWSAGAQELGALRRVGQLVEGVIARGIAAHPALAELRTARRFASGVTAQAANEVARYTRIPGLGLPRGPMGELFEPNGAVARRGADLVQRGVRTLFRVAPTPTPDAMRELRPLLASATIEGRAGATTLVKLGATIDGGRSGGPAGLISAYVDGAYHSTTLLHPDRTTPLRMNLGALAPGDHAIELRHALDRAHVGAGIPRVTDLLTEHHTGLDALIDRHAPIVELRDAARTIGPLGSAADDAPLTLFPQVVTHADRSHTIAYTVIFSNENGGTRTPELMSLYGHALDVEPIYTVRLAADGTRVSGTYQTGIHRWREFDGQFVGERPVLRVSSTNNLFSARVTGARGGTSAGAERWADAPVRVPGIDVPTDHEVLLREPWALDVSERELLREGKVALPGTRPDKFQIHPIERYVDLGPVTPAQRMAIVAQGGTTVRLRDGREVFAAANRFFALGDYAHGAALLPEGVTRDQVVTVAGGAIRSDTLARPSVGAGA